MCFFKCKLVVKKQLHSTHSKNESSMWYSENENRLIWGNDQRLFEVQHYLPICLNRTLCRGNSSLHIGQTLILLSTMKFLCDTWCFLRSNSREYSLNINRIGISNEMILKMVFSKYTDYLLHISQEKLSFSIFVEVWFWRTCSINDLDESWLLWHNTHSKICLLLFAPLGLLHK